MNYLSCDSLCTECAPLKHCKLKDFKDVWVYLHHDQGIITKSSLELLSIGRRVADNLKQKLVGVLLGHQLGDLIKQPIMYGADKTLYSDEESMKYYVCLPSTHALAQMVEQYKPNVFLFVSDEIGKDLAQKEGKPLSIYLNPHAPTEIAVNGISGIHMPGDGFKVIKVKVGFRNLFDEIEHLVMLTQSFGKDILFRLDVNGAFDLPQAIRFCKEMEAFNIDYIEQPLPAEELVDLAELSYHTEIPIAVDESLTDYSSAEKIIENQATDVFVIKPMVSGGFTESKKIINLAKEENIRIVITSSLETNIGRMACLHLAAANEITEACGLSTGALLNENTKAPIIENGLIQIPDIPGMGLEL